METLENIKTALLELEKDTLKFFEKKNNSAGTRARKTAQEIKALLSQLRTDIIDARKSMD